MKFAIIAAGKGSRMASEGEMLPKPLVKIGGEPMIKRLIDTFIRCGATAISIIINEEMDEVREYLNSLELPIPLDVIVKSTEGSLLSFYEISDRLKDDKFCLSTVDSVFDEDEFEGYIEKFKSDSDVDGYMAVTSFIDDEIPLYIDVDENNLITKFSDEPWEGVRIISGGIYALSAKAVKVLSDCIQRDITDMRDYQRELVKAGLKLQAYEFEKIIDVDHVNDISIANEFVKEVEHKKNKGNV